MEARFHNLEKGVAGALGTFCTRRQSLDSYARKRAPLIGLILAELMSRGPSPAGDVSSCGCRPRSPLLQGGILLVTSTGPAPRDTLAFFEFRLVGEVIGSVVVGSLGPLAACSSSAAVEVVSPRVLLEPASSTHPYGKSMEPLFLMLCVLCNMMVRK